MIIIIICYSAPDVRCSVSFELYRHLAFTHNMIIYEIYNIIIIRIAGYIGDTAIRDNYVLLLQYF
jgi:hypothetical protein